jgi:threonine/homoserine/homoserine lactone efflux protein
MSFGLGFIAKSPSLKLALGIVSTAFLFLIVVTLTKNWLKRMSSTVQLEAAPKSGNGFLLGLGLSLTSPWNAAFWLAIAGQGMSLGSGWLPSLLLAVSVMAGAGLWVVLLSLSASATRGVVGVKAQRFAEPVSALLMLFFALQSIIRLASV